ncbi:gluconokinase [Nocardia sp. NPDC003693]
MRDNSTDPPRVIVVMGVSGAGKSTVANLLAARLGWRMLEGDDLHPPANIAKMAAGQPLTDADRAPWLAAIAQRLGEHAGAGQSTVVACSALTRSYRDRLRRTAPPNLMFVYLHGTRADLERRTAHRDHAFMPAALLDSQLATLEEPVGETDVVRVETGHSAPQVAAEALAALRSRGFLPEPPTDNAASVERKL